MKEESEKEGKLNIKNERERTRLREKENIFLKKKGKEEGQCVRERRKNFLVALIFVNHSATWNGAKSRKKKKIPYI